MKVLLLTSLLISSIGFAADTGISCKQAYEKTKGKQTYIASTLRHARKEDEFGKGTSRDDVKKAIEYGFKSGMYCQGDKKILSKKEFRAITISNMKAIQAMKVNNGGELISTVKEDYSMNCRDLIAMERSNKKDGFVSRMIPNSNDLHNIKGAIAKSGQETEMSKKDQKLKKMKDRFMRSIRNKAVRKYDNDDISMSDVHKALEASIDDGSVCAGNKVMNRSKMKRHILERIESDKSNDSAVNSNITGLKNSESPVNIIFKQNGVDQKVDIEGIQAQDA